MNRIAGLLNPTLTDRRLSKPGGIMLLEKHFLSVFTRKLKIWCQSTWKGQENLERVFYIGCKVATGFGSFDAKLKIRVGVYSKQQIAKTGFLSYFVNFLNLAPV